MAQQISEQLFDRTSCDCYIFVGSPVIHVKDVIYNGVACREYTAVVKSVQLIRLSGLQYRLGRAGYDVCGVVQIKQRCSGPVTAPSAVLHAVIEHQPPLLCLQWWRASSYLFLPCPFDASEQ